MNDIVNIAAYRFVHLDQLKQRRVELLSCARRLELKGTVLLSTEGINLFVAGRRESVDAFLDELRTDPRLAELEVKESLSDYQPFHRMLVKIKREIIAFGQEGIAPEQYTAPRLAPRDLKRWLDEGRPVVLLDVRNSYEFEIGSFEQAVPVAIDDFRSFPEEVSQLQLEDAPIVTFCTGGIRCEKAAPWMERAGFRNVWQLDGGILKYFEECGGQHYRGDCFVFDRRVALDPHLRETETGLCFACHAVLSAEDQRSPDYEEGVSCPHCYVSPQDRQTRTLAERQAAIRQCVTPLPGSQPYVNRRPIRVPERLDQQPVSEVLSAIRTHLTLDDWSEVMARGLLTCQDVPVRADQVVRAGQHLVHIMPATVEPDVAANIGVLFEDDAIVAINKPAPLPVHPCGRYHRNTLEFMLNEAFYPWKLRPAHRLDSNTSGVMIFSKTRHVARRLQPQFEQQLVNKSYLVRCHGVPTCGQFACQEAISRKPVEQGGRLPSDTGLPAETRFEVVQSLPDGTTLLAARPVTGRTNQIRVHLWHRGLPVVGDPLYLPQGRLGNQQTSGMHDPPMCLHAWQLGFQHPTEDRPMTLTAPAPQWGAAAK